MQTKKSIEQRKAACERVLLDEDSVQRPEDSMDYIYRTLSFRTAPSFPTASKLACKARVDSVEQGRIPKAFGVKTVPRVAKSSFLQVRSLCPLGLPNREVGPADAIIQFVQVRQYAANKRGRRRKSGLAPAVCGVRLTDFGFLSLACGNGSAGAWFWPRRRLIEAHGLP
jgi:hypothetical protein